MARLQRFNLWPVVAYQNRAIRDDPRELSDAHHARVRRIETLYYYGIPTFLAILMLALKANLQGIPQLLSATSLLVGSMLSAFVFLANFRVKVEESEVYRKRKNLPKLIGFSAVGALYVAILAMLLAIILAAMAAFPALAKETWLGVFVSAVAVWLMVHLFISLASVIRKMFGVFVSIFDDDFDAEEV
jgi:hypothetical protein